MRCNCEEDITIMNKNYNSIIMFQKTILTALILLSISYLKLSAQSMVVETTNGDLIAENLVSIQNLKFPNRIMVLRKSDSSTRSFSLLTIKKLYFSPESVNSVESTAIQKIAVYPNPSVDFIRIENAPVQETNVSIYSVNGTKVLQKMISSADNEINVSRLQAGLYFIKMNAQTIKFIKF